MWLGPEGAEATQAEGASGQDWDAMPEGGWRDRRASVRGVSGEQGGAYLWRIFHAMHKFFLSGPTREMRLDLQSARRRSHRARAESIKTQQC
jgi:hypothetical protein